MTKDSAKRKVQVEIEEGVSTATLNGTKVEISPEGNVVVFTNDAVQTKPAAPAPAAPATEDKHLSIGKEFNSVAMYGAIVELGTDGILVVHTNGTVTVKPAPANDTAVQAAKKALEIGARMADGSIFAGLTADGKQQIYAMPNDLIVCVTFNDAAKVVRKLNEKNTLGHDDWQIPSSDSLHILYKNQNEGALKGTFNTSADLGSGFVFPQCYWSSTKCPDNPSFVEDVRFSGGGGAWDRKDDVRLSCRPVRLVEASAQPK